MHFQPGIRRFSLVLALVFSIASLANGQTADNEATPVDKVNPISAGEKFDLIFQ